MLDTPRNSNEFSNFFADLWDALTRNEDLPIFLREGWRNLQTYTQAISRDQNIIQSWGWANKQPIKVQSHWLLPINIPWVEI